MDDEEFGCRQVSIFVNTYSTNLDNGFEVEIQIKNLYSGFLIKRKYVFHINEHSASIENIPLELIENIKNGIYPKRQKEIIYEI